MMEGYGAVLLASGTLSVALAAALWSAANNPAANRYLALVLLVLAGMMSVYILGWTGRVEVPPWLAFMPVNLPLALGPLLYGYVRALATGRELKPPLRHFGPAAVHFLYLCVVIALPASARAGWKDGAHDHLIKPLIEVATLTSLTLYIVAGLRLLGVYRAWLEQERSDADRYAARWIARVLMALLTTFAALALMRFYTWFVAEIEVGPIYMWFGVLSTWLGVEGWRYSERRFPTMGASPGAQSAPRPDWAEFGARWQSQTRAAGWWREPDLSLAELARRLGTNTAYLSRAVNDGLGMNFNEMINRLRAEEVARLLEAGTSANLTQLALEAGFSSKATFNRVFRAIYGTSPSAHRRTKSQISAPRSPSEASRAPELCNMAAKERP
jgi:AraC-like DNA-binding protein